MHKIAALSFLLGVTVTLLTVFVLLEFGSDSGARTGAPAKTSSSGNPSHTGSQNAPIFVKAVQGASGDGNEALKRSVIKALAEDGVTLVQSPEPCAFIVTADVAITRLEEVDHVDIKWFIHSATDFLVGEVKQQNNMKRGALNRTWGNHALHAARGARDGIMEIVNSTTPACT